MSNDALDIKYLLHSIQDLEYIQLVLILIYQRLYVYNSVKIKTFFFLEKDAFPSLKIIPRRV